MSITTHLQSLSSELIITDAERATINTHIETLKKRLLYHFDNAQIAEHFAFGSFTRKTLMPRRADNNSDVDYMVVFNPTKPSSNIYGYGAPTYYEPATYLNWLREFVKAKYSTSEVFQSHPTIVLQLSNFKIEIVPAKKDAFDTYSIPAPASSYSSWLLTTPNAFNAHVKNKNVQENSQIRPLIRIMKYWNARNGYVYSSYDLEEKIVNTYYYNCYSIWEYLKLFVDTLSVYSLGITDSSKVSKLKETCAQALFYEKNYSFYGVSAGEEEIKKVFPVFSR